MNLPLKIAGRYLFSRKISLVNVITLISVLGVAGMTAALVVILSIFNGFDSLISSMINQFDPDLKITPAKGKTFVLDSLKLNELSQIEGVDAMSLCVEETALFQYDNYQHIATLKGVDNQYKNVCDIPSTIYIGDYLLKDTLGIPYAIIGADIASSLWIQVNGLTAIKVYGPLRNSKSTLNPAEAFAYGNVMPAGVFHIHQDFDSKYVIVPLDFATDLLGYSENEVSSIEIKTKNGDAASVAQKIQNYLGNNYIVKDRYQQQDTLYKIMKSEKLSIFVMLTFIIIIASFNIIGALAMLIIDKKNDIKTLSHIGANESFIRNIFVKTGQLITTTGVLAGIIFGLIICWLQIEFQFLRFPEGSYIIEAYPVEIRCADILYTFVVVTLIGFVASMIPTKKIFAK